MKIAIVCKSDLQGGAAIVSYRLMQALREQGADARMVVCEKLSTDPNVIPAGSYWDIKRNFFTERLHVASVNGFNRKTLFQIDPATNGLPLHQHPWIKEADIVLLNWINQGMLSAKGLTRLLETGKPVVWTMHDKWNMTAVCHHSGNCTGFIRHCENCPLLPRSKRAEEFVRKVWLDKHKAYRHENLHFVGVSNWVANEARKSSLMAGIPVTVIPNAFPADSWSATRPRDGKDIIAFGAARLDDPVKGLPWLKAAISDFVKNYPERAANTELALFGSLRNPDAIKSLEGNVRYLGTLSSEGVRNLLEQSKIILSTSTFETLPTTLIEGQAAGAFPISFDRGGQSDIIDHDNNGFLINFDENPAVTAPKISRAIITALDRWTPDLAKMLHADVRTRFSAPVIAARYLQLIDKLTHS